MSSPTRTMTREVGKMPAVANKYAVKGIAAPKVIKSDAQLEHYTAQLLELERREYLSPAERDLAELLTILIEKYEDEHYPSPPLLPMLVFGNLPPATILTKKNL